MSLSRRDTVATVTELLRQAFHVLTTLPLTEDVVAEMGPDIDELYLRGAAWLQEHQDEEEIRRDN